MFFSSPIFSFSFLLFFLTFLNFFKKGYHRWVGRVLVQLWFFLSLITIILFTSNSQGMEREREREGERMKREGERGRGREKEKEGGRDWEHWGYKGEKGGFFICFNLLIRARRGEVREKKER
jgi:energy-coupling factor transporter transmembrane protein EcfT